MKKTRIQFLLFCCVIIELMALYKMFETSNVMHQKLFTGLAIFFILIIIKSLSNLTENNYGN
jgi:hypothetical protein